MPADGVLLVGTTDGHEASGLVGYQDPFPTEELNSYFNRRYIETVMATLQGGNLGFRPSWNDVVYSYRMAHTKGSMGAQPAKLLAGYSPVRALGQLNPAQINVAQATNPVDPVTGATVTMTNANVTRGGVDLAAAGVVTVPAQVDNVAIIALLSQDPGLFTGPLVHIRRTDANNWIRVSRQSATNIRVEKDVATVITTELDTTIAATESITGAAIGVRINGTRCRVFLNGGMIADFTLSAGAQGLAGTLAGVELADVARQKLEAFSVWNVT